MFDPKEEERMMKRAFARYVIPTVIALVFEQIAPIPDDTILLPSNTKVVPSALGLVDVHSPL